MNLPNILTLSRIGMIVLVVILSIFCGPKIDDVHSISALGISYLTVRIIAVALAFLAALTAASKVSTDAFPRIILEIAATKLSFHLDS